MVAIISGNGAGLVNSSSGLTGQDRATEQGASREAGFLNIANGNLVLQRRDDFLAAAGVDLKLVRTYNSQGDFNDGTGRQRAFGLQKQVGSLRGAANAAGSTVLRLDGDGSVTQFDYDTNSARYLNENGSQSLELADLRWTWRDESGNGYYETYDQANSGRILMAGDVEGARLHYDYRSDGLVATIGTSSGDMVHFDYDANGNLAQYRTLAIDTGRQQVRVRYGYDSLDRLTSVTTDLSPQDNSIADGNSYLIQYSYVGDSNRIASVEQTDGTRIAMTYQLVGGAWKVASVIDAQGVVTIEYGQGQTVLADAAGTVTIYHYDDKGRLLSIGGADGVPQASFAYDTHGNVVRAASFGGEVLTYEYGAHGQRVAVRGSNGMLMQQREFSPTGRLLAEISYDGALQASQTSYVYNSAARLVFVVAPDGEVEEYQYDSAGQRTATIRYLDVRYHNVARAEPDLRTWADKVIQQGAARQRISFTYDVRGLVASRTDDQGTTSYVYDQGGQLLQLISPDGRSIHYAYDGLGRQLLAKEEAGPSELSDFDTAGTMSSAAFDDGVLSAMSVSNDGMLLFAAEPQGMILASADTIVFPRFASVPHIRTTGDFTFSMDAFAGRFGTTDVDFAGLNFEMMPNAMMDIWANSDGTITKLTFAPDAWGSAPRFDDKLFVARVQAGSLKIDDVFLRGDMSLVETQLTYKDYVLETFMHELVVPDSTGSWGNSTLALAGDVLHTSQGFLYRVVSSGTLGTAEPAVPNYLDGKGVGAFWSGSAIVEYVGAAQYSGAWQMARNGGLRWYYTNIAAGHLASRAPAEVRRYLDAEIKNVVRDWSSGRTYQVGMKVGGPNTAGMIWECVGAGSTGFVPEFAPNAAVGAVVTESWGVKWRAVGPMHGSAQWFIADSNGEMTATRESDAHDSGAATLAWAVKQYLDATGDYDWLQQASVHAGMSNADVLKSVLYHNVLTQFVPGLNLTRTFQNDEAPSGGSYSARFMMDNVEVWAGLNAAAKMFKSAGDLDFGNYVQAFADTTLNGLEGLWQESAGAYKWEASADMAAAPELAAFYPYVSSQYWASFWGVPLQHARVERAAQYADAHFKDWQIRSDGDDFASLGVHYGRYLQGKTSDLFEVLDGARRRHLRTTLPGEVQAREFTAADGALFLLMQDLPAGPTTKFGGLGLENLEQGAQLQNVPGAAGLGREQTRVVVNTGNGNLVLQEHDTQLAASGFDLGLTRTYNSQGGGWQLGTGRSVRLDAVSGVAYRRNGDGSESRYVLNDGVYQSDDGAGAYDRLVYDQLQQEFTWTDGATAIQETYDGANGGRLVSSRDLSGNLTSYGYDAFGRLQQIIDASGEKLVMAYDGAGRLLTVRTDYTFQGQARSSTRVYYEYDADGRLSMVKTDLSPDDNSIGDGGIYWTKYSYIGASGLVSDVEQKDGSKLHLTYQQDSPTGAWWVDTMTDGEGRLTRVLRARDGSTIEDPTGRQIKYVYTEAGKLQKVSDLATGEYSHYTYDEHGNVVTVTDAQGLINQFSYDEVGNQVEDRIAGERRITRTFSKPGLLLTETVAADDGSATVQTTRLVYDGQDRLRFVLTPEGRVSEWRYNAKGEKTSEVAYSGAMYDLAGLDAKTAPSESQMVTWASATDRSHTILTVYTYDGRSLLATSTTYSAVAADGSGIDNGNQTLLRFVYDQVGLLRQTIDSRQRQVSYSYDGLGRQTCVVDSERPDAVFTVYDDVSRTTITTGTNGNRTIEVSDRSGQLLNRTVLAGAASGTTTYVYNAKGQPVMIQDAAGVRSFVLYDDKGLKVASVDGDGSLTEYRYGRNGEPSHSIAYTAKINIASLVGADGKPIDTNLAALRPAAQSGDRHVWTIYDKQGRLVQTIGPAGYITTTNYDAVGRVESVVRHATPIDTGILSGRDSLSPLNLYANYGDSVIRNFYDNDGKQTATLDGAGSLSEFEYGPAGKLLSSVTYQKLTNWSQRLAGSLAALRADVVGSAAVTHYLYDGKGLQVGVVNAAGALTETVYDTEGNAVRKVRYATPVSWQANASLASLRPGAVPADRGWNYTYTKLNQLETETAPDLTVTRYSYDKLGKVISVERFAGTPLAASAMARYDAAGLVTAELPAEASWRIAVAGQDSAAKESVWTNYAVCYQYDNAGRRTSMTVPGGARTLYYYDTDGRLVHTVNSLGQAASTEFNAFNQVSRSITYDAVIPAATLATLSGGNAVALAPVLQSLAPTAVVSRTLYNVEGKIAASVDPLGALTSFRYDAFGNVSESFAYAVPIDPLMAEADIRAGIVSGAFADVARDRHQRFDYDGDGRLVATFTAVLAGPGGQQWSVATSAYDGAGNLVATTTFAEPITHAAPTAADIFWKQPSASDERIRIAYDASGRVAVTATAQKFEGGGYVWTLQTREYDANGLLAAQRTLATQLFSGEPTADDLGAAALLRNPADNEVRYAYDAMGRVTRTASTQGAAGGAMRWSVTGVSYDKAGNVTQRTDFATLLSSSTLPQNASQADYEAWLKTVPADATRDRSTRYVYDAGNRLHYTIDPAGSVVGQEYDARGNVVQLTAYATQASGVLPANFTPVGNVKDSVSRTVYDVAGRARYSINAEGGVSELRYDAQGRVASTLAFANRIPAQSLSPSSTPQDVAALLATRLDAANDRALRNVYDQDGRLRFSIDPLGGVTERRYDANGNLSRTISYALGLAGTLADGAIPQVVATAPGSGAYVLSNVQDRVTDYVYDASGRLTSRTDGAGTAAAATLSWAYDSAGNVIRHTDGRGNTSWSAYDASHRLVRHIDAAGYVTSRSYFPDGRAKSETRYSNPVALPASANDGWAYDFASNPASNTDPVKGDRTTSWTYDGAGRMQTSTDAAGGVTFYAYDILGNLTDTTVAYGTSAAATLHRVYDRASRVSTETHAYGSVDAFTTQYGYDAWGNRTSIGVGGVTTTQYFDVLGRKTGVKDANQALTTTTYNAFGDIVKMTDALGNAGYFYTDALGRVTMQVDPEGSVSEMCYDLQGNAVNTIHYANKVKGPVSEASRPQVLPAAGSGVYVVQTQSDQNQQSYFDVLGRRMETRTWYSGTGYYTESFTYDGNGNKKTMTSRNGAVTSYDYDNNNRLVIETLPVTVKNAANADVPVENRLEYDALGNVVKKTEAYGLPEQRITMFVFDKLNRQVKEVGEATTTFDATTRQDVLATPAKEQKYDLRGNVIEEIDARGGRTLHFYDNGNRETGRIDAAGTYTRFAYDSAGQKASQTIYANAVQMVGGGPISSAIAPTLLAPESGLPASGAYLRLDAGNDRTVSYTYDGMGRLKTTTIDGITTGAFNKASNHYVVGSGSIRTQTFYDATGNVVKTIDANGNVTRNYYNRAGRLMAQLDAKRYLTVYQFDAFGNVDTQATYANAVAASVLVDDSTTLQQLTLVASADDRITKFTYDRMGRTRSESRLNLDYAAVDGTSGTLAEMTGAATSTYEYDGLSNLIKSTDANGDVTDWKYDNLGRKTEELQASFVDYRGLTVRTTTDFEYDGLGQVRREIARGEDNTTEGDDRITRYFYGTGGFLSSQIDSAGARIDYRIDAAGNITRKTLVGRINADGVRADDVTYYWYDKQGRETRHNDGATGTVVETRYNAFGEISGKRTNPAPGSTEWAEFTDYDQTGHAWRTNAGDGITHVYLYDANGNATLKLDDAVTDLRDSAQKTWTLLGVLNLVDTNQFFSVYDARNQLSDTFQPSMDGSHDIITVEESLTQKQGTSFAGVGVVRMGVAAGLHSAATAIMPSATGAVTVSPALNAAVTLTDRYTVANKYYDGPALRSASHTLTVSLPDTSSWGSGAVRVDISIPESEPLMGYQGSFYPTPGAPTLTFNEPIDWEYDGMPGGRDYTITIYKEGPTGLVVIGTKTIWRSAPSGTSTVNTTIATSGNAVRFNDQRPDTTRLILMTRPSGSTGGWTINSVPKALVNGVLQDGSFIFDWSGMARSSYEFRYVCLNGDNDVVNSQQGTMVLSDSSPLISQVSHTMGGAGRAFVDAGGNIVFNELGGQATSLTVNYRPAGSNGAWSTQVLGPSSVGGATLPGWFTFATDGLWGTYEYSIEAKNAAGTALSKSTSNLTVGSPSSVNDPSGTSVQTSPIANVVIAAVGATALQVNLSRTINVDWNWTYNPPVGKASNPINTLTMQIPDTRELGNGNIRVEVTLDGTANEEAGGSYSGFSGSFIVPFGETSHVFNLPEIAYGAGGFDATSYSYTLFKQTPYGDVQLVAHSGDALPGDNWSSPGTNINLVTFDVQSSGAQATTMLLEYRLRPETGGWSVVSIPPLYINGNAVPGHFATDWTTWPAGTYDYRTVALDVNANLLQSSSGAMTVGVTATPNVVPEPNDLIGGAGRVFMDTAGNLNITEQGSATTSMTIRYRGKNSSGLWSARTFLQPQAAKGWFVFAPPADAQGELEYVIEARNSSNQLLNKTAGTFTRGDANSVSPLAGYSEPPVVTHFTSQPANAATVRLSYRLAGTGAYTTVSLTKITTGLFDWASSSVFSSDTINQNYDYSYESLDSNGVLVNKAHGVATLGRDPMIVSHISDSVPTLASFNVPSNNDVAATATSMVLRYRMLGSTGAFGSVELAKNAVGAFVWDASALVPPSTSGAIDYNYTLKNGSNILKRDDGADITIDGTLYLGPTDGDAQLKWLASGTVNASALIHHTQATNAFGEVVSETNARGFTTVSVYNALGKLVRKEDPNVSATLSNGYQQSITPRTFYYYDRDGRMLASRDANGNLTSQALLAGSGAVTKEFHADGGNKVSGYDIFGDLRYGKDEIGLRTDYSYDKDGRLTLIQRPLRTDGMRAEVTMTYDEAGNRITQAATPDATSTLASYTSKTYYDSLGRVSKVLTPTGRGSTYTYVWDAAIKSTGGRVVGGWRQIVSDPMGRTVIEEIDAYGRTTAHTDLGGHKFIYNFNSAGWISSQSGTTGQNISYTYYANGYVRSIRDIALQTETTYEYDAAGNRVYESYQRTVDGKVEYLENASIDYDSNNRVTRIRDPRSDIQYEYDAVGNRRRVHSVYHDGLGGSMQVQDYWYDYDNMNRFTLTMGKLSSANGARGTSATDASVKVVLGDRNGQGVQVFYNKASQRIETVTARDGHREDYTYGAEGYLELTYINADASARGALASIRVNDRLGRTIGYTEYNNGSISYQRGTVYTADGRQKSQTGTDGNTTYYYYDLQIGGVDSMSGINSDGVGELAKVLTTKDGAATIINVTAYDYWDDAKQRSQTVNGEAPYKTDTVWRPGVSSFAYDVNGHLVKAVDAGVDGKIDTADDVTFNYINNGQGLVLRREQFKGNTIGMFHRYMYLNGGMVGDVGNDHEAHLDYAQILARSNQSREQMYKNWRPISSADFDQNYQPITREYPAAAGSSYTVKSGDTLYSIAGAVWGDVSMWYLIADANGLNSETELAAGQTLVIPNKVTNIHNNNGTFRPYEPGAVMGDTSPTLPDAPMPAPPPGKHGCGGLGQIVMIVVAVVVTAMTSGAAFAAFGEFFGPMMAAAAGSIASQAVGMAIGVQDKFSWKSVGMSALSAGIGGGGAGFASAAGNVVGSALTQAIGSKLGLVDHFNWRNVAATAVGSIAGEAVGGAMQGSEIGQYVGKFGTKFAKSMTENAIAAAVGRQSFSWKNITIGAFGNALGNSLAANLTPKGRGFDPMAELDRVGAEILSGKGPRLAAGYGDDMNPLPALQGRDTENGQLLGRIFVTRSNYFDPTKDSLLFDAQSGGGNLLRRDTMSDGRTRDVFADGYLDTDADGKSTFTRADTSLDFVSAKSFDDVVSRYKYLDHKYDPNSLGDRFLNLFTGAMDNPDRVLSAAERTERDLLDHRMYVARDQAQHPENYSPFLQHMDNIRESGLSNAVYQTARAAGADEQKRRDLARLGKAAGDVGFARAAAVSGGPAYTGARGRPGLVENNAGGPVNPGNAVRQSTLLGVVESANALVESLRNNGTLPPNYVTKQQAVQNGWQPGKAVGNFVKNGQIGGDIFFNDDGVLPSARGRVWHEADIGLDNAMTRTKQPGTRLLYSTDGLLYVTTDHYITAHHIGKWK